MRAGQHKAKTFKGFTSRYGVARLVWFERHATRDAAFRRERQIKKWNRPWKLRLIEESNPDWKDLAEEIRLGDLKDAEDWIPAFAGMSGNEGSEMTGSENAQIEAGQPAPAFDMATSDGGRVSSASLSGKPYVLYFYPKADTPGCTSEGQDFSALADQFAAAGATVVGASRDPVKKLDRFKAKYDLKVVLASDEPGDVTAAFGVWGEKSMYGRTYMGVERATFLIDGAGVVRRAWRKVRVKGHAAEVLAALQSL